MKSNRLSNKIRFQLMKEFELILTGPRKGLVTTSEFADEMTRELGTEINARNIETCAEAFGVRLSDVFKAGARNAGRSLYAELYKLEKRVEALELTLKGLE